jgi:hypothetical protein
VARAHPPAKTFKEATNEAKARVAEAGLRNVSFTQTDVNQIVADKPFDAGRRSFHSDFLPDPVSVLRSLSKLVRPGEPWSSGSRPGSLFSLIVRLLAA